MPKLETPIRVVAVVVAFNRRDLLHEALDALATQTRPAEAVVVVDNASTDGSGDVAREHPLPIDLVTLSRNTGGAGGFAAGLARAIVAHGAEWVWLMDDDTIPTPQALARMVEALADDVVVAGSRVVWTDGQDHPMNTPRRKPFVARAERTDAEARGTLPVRSSSFVSMLVSAQAVRDRGLPVADYFIWNDDFEFSTRMLRGKRGIFVPASVVVHKTKVLGSTDVDPGPRFYYEVRNKIWLLRLSRGLNPLEKILYGASTIRRWLRTLRRSEDPGVLRAGFRRGLKDGFQTRPRRNSEALAGLGEISAQVEEIELSAGSGR